MKLLLLLVINALALLATAYLVPGIDVDSFLTALVAALVLAILNTSLKPLLIIFTLPVNFLTLGLFSWVISAIVLWLTGFLVSGFEVQSFLSALVGGIVLAFVSSLLRTFVR